MPIYSFFPRKPARYIAVLGIAFLSLLSQQLPAQSQATPPAEDQIVKLEYNRPAKSLISDNRPQEDWRVIVSAKDRISVTVTRTSDTLVPTIELLDENDRVIAQADHDPSYARAAITNFTMPAPGAYTLRVSRYKNITGKTFGAYTVVVNLLGAGEDGMNPKFVETSIPLGTPRTGTITEARWRDTWAIQSTGVAPLTITVTRAAGTLVPVLKLYDSTWTEVATGQLDDTFAVTAIRNYVPAAAGQYYIAVSRLDGTTGGTIGDYQLLAVQGQ